MAAPALPSSLSPHICVLSSQDLVDVLQSVSLPSLPQILESFSPLPQITTRTAALTSIQHSIFAVRFSDLSEIEEGCREPEEQRAGRFIDWIGARIAQKAPAWIEQWESSGAAANERSGDASSRTPWWEELCSCVEGDRTPSRVEGWNHPVAVILAVSTSAPNPLQSLAQLHARSIELPQWVDSSHLRYTLIIHTKRSSLSDEEAAALFNAAKKQYGLHAFLLTLELPTELPRPVTIPLALPRLPPHNESNVSNSHEADETRAQIHLSDQDIVQMSKFIREFVTMSLIPWMERCIIDWNENFSSTRRLPSRLFSSTRRLFGSASPSPTPSQPPSTTVTRTHSVSGSISSTSPAAFAPTTFPQQRRLAEFATILGDLKTAVPVWESIRKEAKGGSEILPLLLSPSPASILHVQHALSTITLPGSELTASGYVRSLMYAMRWELGLLQKDLLSDVLEGERWLVWASASADEPPLALLLAQAAYLSVRKNATRRAALWYLFAANRLEKSGIKSLTMYFLRRAHELYLKTREVTLSPSFYDANGFETGSSPGFDSIVPGIEYALGRLHYTTGDIIRAVKFFLSLLRSSQTSRSQVDGELDVSRSVMDKGALDDFQTAFQHLREISRKDAESSEFELPITFFVLRKARVRLAGNSSGGNADLWKTREESWRSFWRTQGKESLEKYGKAAVNELFWIELAVHNPLNVEVSLSNVTLLVENPQEKGIKAENVNVEVIPELTLGAKETCIVPFSIRATSSGTLSVTRVSYEFLSLLHTTESLAMRGRRLHETSAQRQGKVYAPDVFLEVEIEEASHRLSASFVDDDHLVLGHGECRRMRIWLSNEGLDIIDDFWLVPGADDEFIVSSQGNTSDAMQELTELFHSDNSITRLPPYHLDGITLDPGASSEFPIVLRADRIGTRELCILVVFRKRDSSSFHSARIVRSFNVEPLVSVTLEHYPSCSIDDVYSLNVVIRNTSSTSELLLYQLETMSPTWSCSLRSGLDIEDIQPDQIVTAYLSVSRTNRSEYRIEAPKVFNFVSERLKAVLLGLPIEETKPPPLSIQCSHTMKTTSFNSKDPTTALLVNQARRNATICQILRQHPNIPPRDHPHIFPLYHPNVIDIVLHWKIPAGNRGGFVFIPGPILGAQHGMLDTIIQEVERTKAVRSMYAETQLEKAMILDAVLNSEWNAEMNPITIRVQDCGVIVHDFSSSICVIPMTFTLRNFSIALSAKYRLKLSSPIRTTSHPSSAPSPPSWIGKLTFGGALEPLQHTQVRAMLHVPRPDSYVLGGWSLEVGICDSMATVNVHDTKRSQPIGTRQYLEFPVDEDFARITVINGTGPNA